MLNKVTNAVGQTAGGLTEMSWAAAASPLPRLGVPLLPQNQKLQLFNLAKTRDGNPCRLLSHLIQSRHHVKQLPITTTIGWCSSTSPGAASPEEEDDSFSHQTQDFNLKNQQSTGFWMKWKENSAEISRKLAKLGLAAVLAYGLFDGFTYTTFFVLAFLGYEKSTGKNPAANLRALLGIVILMWTGNNVTRPFRVAGAAALAPFIDKGLRRIQRQFNFPNLVSVFALVAAIVAASCLTVVVLLILSRWGK